MYFSSFQSKTYKTKNEISDVLKEHITKESFEKSRLYGLDKSNYRMIKETYEITLTTLTLYFQLMYVAWSKCEEIAVYFNISPVESEIFMSNLFIIAATLFNAVVYLPFTIYATFVLEEKHGFNKQTVGFFIKDQIKSLLLNLVITLPIVSVALYIIMLGGNMFVVWLWLFTTVATLILLTIYPSVIAPLFDKFIPLPEGSLRKGIEELATKLNFPLSQVYIVEGSKRSAHSNAYFTGIFGEKRIVLFDTLLEKYDEEKKVMTGCTEQEVLSILAHELGHWKCNHVIKSIILTELNLLLIFTAFGLLFKHPLLYSTLGFPTGQQPLIIGLIVVLQIILAPYNTILSFLAGILSRSYEYEADNFAVSLSFTDELITSLIKLGKDNLEFPYYDRLYSIWHHSHPTLLDRIDNLKKQIVEKKKNK